MEKIYIFLKLKSVKLPEVVKACHRVKMQKSHIKVYLLLQVQVFLTYNCIDTINGYY